MENMNNCFSSYSRKIFSLAFIKQDNNVLLGYKKRGLGKGKWNGFGGKLEEGENSLQAAIREMKEECGLEIFENAMTKIGRLEFTFEDKQCLMEVHIFITSEYIGKLIESEEMKPKWFELEDIPYENMWPDDRIWYPLMFQGKKFEGQFHLRGENVILSHWIKEVHNVT